MWQSRAGPSERKYYILDVWKEHGHKYQDGEEMVQVDF